MYFYHENCTGAVCFPLNLQVLLLARDFAFHDSKIVVSGAILKVLESKEKEPQQQAFICQTCSKEFLSLDELFCECQLCGKRHPIEDFVFCPGVGISCSSCIKKKPDLKHTAKLIEMLEQIEFEVEV